MRSLTSNLETPTDRCENNARHHVFHHVTIRIHMYPRPALSNVSVEEGISINEDVFSDASRHEFVVIV